MNAPVTEGAELSITKVSHSYGAKVALRDVSLEIKGSEVLALLGPSGSGKSTLLAIIAGMVRPDSGEVSLRGRNLIDLPTELRGLGMVFQDFALWPHMTVAQNVALPLRARRCSSVEVATRTETALARVGLAGFSGRRPHQLSGGQQQRVALARAVVADTALLLLDEPLSALDPATRSAVRSELGEILRSLNLISIIVTHDREEAFEIADSVAVLVDGRIQQHGLPEDVYERPANDTVARFMGSNIIAVCARSDGTAELHDGGVRLKVPRTGIEGTVRLAIVPEQVRIVDHPIATTENVLGGHVTRTLYRGGEYRVQVTIAGPTSNQTIEGRAKVAPRDDVVWMHLPAHALHVIEDPPPVSFRTDNQTH